MLQVNDDVKSTVHLRKGSSVCGLTAVVNICRMSGIPLELHEAYRRSGTVLDHKRGISLLGCKRALESSGLRCETLRFKSVLDLPEAVPILLTLKGEDQTKSRLHAVVALRRDKRLLIIDGHEVNEFRSIDIDRKTANIAIITTIVNNSEREVVPCQE